MPYPPNWLLWIVVIFFAIEVTLFVGKAIYGLVKYVLWKRRNVMKTTISAVRTFEHED